MIFSGFGVLTLKAVTADSWSIIMGEASLPSPWRPTTLFVGRDLVPPKFAML